MNPIKSGTKNVAKSATKGLGLGSVIGGALWAPDIIEGGAKTSKNVKKQLSGINKYDSKLGIEPPKRYSSNGTIGNSPLNKTAEIQYYEPKNNQHDKDVDVSKYIVPAALLSGGTIRAYQTGNALQLVNDVGGALGKLRPKKALRRSKNPYVRMMANMSVDKKTNPNSIPKNHDNGFKAGIKWGTGMAGAEILVNKLFGNEYADNNWREEQKKAKNNQNKKNKNKYASISDYCIEKEAKEIPGAKGFVTKVLTEGIAQPAVTAVPIVAVPTGISLAINKDIKGDLGPVRESLNNDKRKKIKLDDNDPRSSNNYAVNSEIMQVATDTAYEMTKEAANIKFKPFRNADGTKKMYHIKNWRDFFDELPISGLRAASLAVPTAYLVKHDPVAKHREIQSEKAKKKQERAIVNKAVDKAVDKAVEQAVEQIQTM